MEALRLATAAAEAREGSPLIPGGAWVLQERQEKLSFLLFQAAGSRVGLAVLSWTLGLSHSVHTPDFKGSESWRM